MTTKRRHTKKLSHGKQGDRRLIAVMGRSLEGGIDFIERMTGERLTAEEIEELRGVLPEAWLHGDEVQ